MASDDWSPSLWNRAGLDTAMMGVCLARAAAQQQTGQQKLGGEIQQGLGQ